MDKNIHLSKIKFAEANNIIEINSKENSNNINVTNQNIKKNLSKIYNYEFISIRLINKFSKYKIHCDNEHFISINEEAENINWYENEGVIKFVQYFNYYKFRRYFIQIFNNLCKDRLKSKSKNKNLHFKVGDLIFKIDKVSY